MRKANIIITALVILSGFIGIFGQQQYIGNSFTSPAVAPGAPTGAYRISDIENVNLSNGNLNVSLPLLQIGGRGTAGYTMMLPIENKWNIRQVTSRSGDHGNVITHHYFPEDNWGGFSPNRSKYSPGSMRGQRASDIPEACHIEATNPLQLVNPPGRVLSRFVFIGADGTQVEFYDQRTKGKPAYFPGCEYNPDDANRGTVWESNAGVTFVNDVITIEEHNPSYDTEITPSGVLIFPNGNRYRIDQGLVSYIIDRDGNKVSFVYFGQNVSSITDSLGRVITINYGYTDASSDFIFFKGTDGTTRTIEVGRNLLGNLLKTGQTLKSTLELFPGLAPDSNSNDFRNPRRVAYLKLPDGRQYNFRYDSYSDIARIEYPTGGAVEYEWDGYVPVPQIMRWVTERREYPNGETGANYKLKTKYEYFHDDPPLNGKPNGNTQVTHFSPSSSGDLSIGVSKHYFIRDEFMILTDQFSWGDGRFGTEYKTETYSSNGVSLINKVVNEYEFRQVYTFAITYPNTSIQTSYNRLNFRPVRTTTTLADVTPNLVSKKEFGYDQNVAFNRQTDVYEYDFGNGIAGAFLRRQHTDYLSLNPNQGNADYLSSSIYLRNLLTQTWVSSDITGTNKVSLSQIEYDDYSENPLVPRANVVGHDTASFGTNKMIRGNVTKVTTYSDVNDANTAISVKSQYDILGNVVKVIDAKDNATTIDYSDRFGAPDNEARSNTQPTELGGLSTFAFPTSSTNPPSSSNAVGWVRGYSQIDYYTGQSVNTEDLNGVISKTIYNDPLDRPTHSVSAIGTPFEIQSNILYDDLNKRVEVKKDIFALNDNLAKGESFYDGLGRTFETRKYESDGGYITSKTEFDALGRPKRATNPYRPLRNETVYWTESFYDSLGRVIKIKTPDNAEVTTSYIGNTVTVTDQALKQRRSVTNALGQLTRVDEPNDAGNLGTLANPTQPTNYAYDTLNNLVQVQQIGTTTQQCGGSPPNCTQTRTFAYDSLSRLKQANNPESGIINYVYDNNGNLTSKIDARSITTTYGYDSLNRVLTRNYTGEVGYQTPNVAYTYDNLTNAKGKLIKVTTAATATNQIAETRYLTFDILGRVTSSQQMTDNVTYNPQSYVYNLSGALIEEVYPSGRVVRNTLDQNGDLAQVQSRKANDTFKNYANAFTYTSAGAVSSLRLANGKFENTTFNSRLQPIQIGLGSSATNQNLLKLNFDYGLADNDGNVKSQTITVPTVGVNQGFVATQNYSYDSLNRLKSAVETIPNQTGWKQTFIYDRYGNRTFDTANGSTTTLLSGCPVNVCNPSANVANNKLVGANYDNVGNTISDASNQSYVYDAENKQVQVSNSNGIVGQYFYDGDGKRIKKIVPSTQETTIFVYDASGKMVAEYSTVTALQPEAKISYLTSDRLGSPRITTDRNGQVISRRDFRPFGEEIVRASYGADTVRNKFTGYERDTETEEDFAQARYYNKNLGRFNSVDAYNIIFAMEMARNSRKVLLRFILQPQNWNKYSYVLNKPLSLVDPKGLSACDPSTDPNCKNDNPPLPKECVGCSWSTDVNGKPVVVGQDGKPWLPQLPDETVTVNTSTASDGAGVPLGGGDHRPNWFQRNFPWLFGAGVTVVGTSATIVATNAAIVSGLGVTDGMIVTEEAALVLAEEFLGSGYTEDPNVPGRYISADGTRTVRMTDGDLTGHNGRDKAHMNFETHKPNPKKPGKVTRDKNYHVYLNCGCAPQLNP